MLTVLQVYGELRRYTDDHMYPNALIHLVTSLFV